MLTFLI